MPPAEADAETARRVRDAAARLVAQAYEEAGTLGLCAEGALEYALDRLRHAEPGELLVDDASTTHHRDQGRQP
ncbi:MAG: hypothetical protein U5K73_00305 [Halofilum sp. (in: g-proteobacteria)]|nr:hypothetical protein [Halofilum sp. (in: g-proteobacteria)]